VEIALILVGPFAFAVLGYLIGTDPKRNNPATRSAMGACRT